MSSELEPEKNRGLDEFAQEEEEENYLYYNCPRCPERHPVGEHPHREEESE